MDLRRTVARSFLSALARWPQPDSLREGWTLVIGVPWDLRDLLAINLAFTNSTDLAGLHETLVVFDRPWHPDASRIAEETRARFPGLNIRALFQPRITGTLLRIVNQSKFYATTNWVLGLAEAQTRHAILHDFDLYPLQRDYFQIIRSPLRDHGVHFSGTSYTQYGGLTESDALLATWALGIDVFWIRSKARPADCYHRAARLDSRRCELDPFCYTQLLTPLRIRVTVDSSVAFSHVVNLCSTYLRLKKREAPHVAWRLHYLLYLRHIDSPEAIQAASRRMASARSSQIEMFDMMVDFANVHQTCANVLRTELAKAEAFLFGGVRPHIDEYIRRFDSFLRGFGDRRTLYDADGRLQWSATRMSATST